MNNAPLSYKADGSVDQTVGVNLMELHGSYKANNLTAILEYGNIAYTDNENADGTSGYYLDLGYNISEIVSCNGKLIPWFRYGNIQKNTNMADIDAHYDVMKFGISYYPIEQITFKLDYGKNTYPDQESKNVTLINMGIGYMF